MKSNLVLPAEMEPYREKFEQSIKPSIRIKPENQPASLFQSKYGGAPYFPLGLDYPTDSSGNPLKLLAQINFEELPANQLFPDRGMLQFYIAVDGNLGSDFNDLTSQSDFRVMYWETIDHNVDNLMQDFTFVKTSDDFPIREESRMTFELAEECVNPSSEREFTRLFNEDSLTFFQELFEDEEDTETWYNRFVDNASGHKMAGYPYFYYSDPRGPEFDVLLLQVATDGKANIEYGFRGGAAGFFIPSAALLKRDFSNILYHWWS